MSTLFRTYNYRIADIVWQEDNSSKIDVAGGKDHAEGNTGYFITGIIKSIV
ncbi:hypothetical protein SAMN05421730_100814 [Anaerobium acetethylicum]|uniref:Uncharacterized protein n=1 Tax=Anaerobium acetethylicum TaxID=1619234 RepID=A0A1D3TSY2_9FIRM|nr:hypothetical protein SAMN05421730_100814 [Anaerobium acetethylicum]